MNEKRFIGYDFGEYENRNYAVYDLSKSEKIKEDFWDNENDCYDIWAFMDYLEENDCILSCDDVVGLLNTLHEENEQLRNEIIHLKDDLQYFKTKSAMLEEELLGTRGCMYE